MDWIYVTGGRDRWQDFLYSDEPAGPIKCGEMLD